MSSINLFDWFKYVILKNECATHRLNKIVTHPPYFLYLMISNHFLPITRLYVCLFFKIHIAVINYYGMRFGFSAVNYFALYTQKKNFRNIAHYVIKLNWENES